MIQRTAEQETSQAEYIDEATGQIIERLLGVMEAFSKLSHDRLRSMRIAAGRSSGDVTCERQHMLPEREEASDLVRDLKHGLLQFPTCWIDRELRDTEYATDAIRDEVSGRVRRIVDELWMSTRKD